MLPNRLVQRLIHQQWPPNLIRWVQTFLTKRSASIQLDGTLGQSFPLTGSLPQGSPVSPILFMLYLELLFSGPQLPGTLQRRGYADNGRITAQFNSLEDNCNILAQELLAVRQWCQDKHISLDLKKTELIYFSRKKNNSNPSLRILPTSSETITHHTDNMLAPTPLRGSLRWLGVYFDRKLTFRQHVTIIAQKGKKTAQAL